MGESDADPANLRQSEWSIGQETTEEYRDISRWGADPLNELEEGDAAWLDVAVSLNDPRAAREDWVGCKQAWIDQPCAYELQMVAEPTGEDGEIVYTRGVVPEDSNPGCAEFAACMAKARLGQRIEGLRGGPRGLIMTGTAARPDPDFEDPEALRRMIEVLEDDLEAAESMENGDPMFEFRRRVQALVVQMWKEELAAM